MQRKATMPVLKNLLGIHINTGWPGEKQEERGESRLKWAGDVWILSVTVTHLRSY